jgi:EAL domain-containing protein (putative c-di-GMP-specific phosphodiesterase class I)
LRVDAEGVEDHEQVRLLRELGCDQIQGFYVSRPVPADQVGALLNAPIAA